MAPYPLSPSDDSPPRPIAELPARQRAWVEVNTRAITHNARSLRRFLDPGAQLMAVVKADGYGHGAVPVALAALAGGASSLGVATLAEALELRQARIRAPLLILGNLTQVEELRCCLQWQLMPTISGMREALLCQNLASSHGRPMQLQLKLDTGMGRLGVDWQEGPRLVAALAGLDAIELAGVYSHLASADLSPDADDGLTASQQQRFADVLSSLQQQGLAAGCRHLANSAATLRDRSLHFDMVRVGLSLYGHAPAPHLSGALSLQAAMAVRARISFIREVPAGVGVSYGHSFRTQRPSRLAVVSIGYADGVPRLLSNRLQVLIAGQRVPQVGAITMDQLIVDVTDLPSLELGTVVTLLGQDGSGCITPAEWSGMAHTIPWEVLCGFKHRLPRLVERGEQR